MADLRRTHSRIAAAFLNLGHAFDHLAMSIFPIAALAISRELGRELDHAGGRQRMALPRLRRALRGLLRRQHAGSAARGGGASFLLPSPAGEREAVEAIATATDGDD
jgi:hypothetical protein